MVKRFIFALIIPMLIGTARAEPAECVIFLHGLARTFYSMEKAASTFSDEGFAVANVDYPSRDYPIEELTPLAVEKGLNACPAGSTIHFVTHSLGGILVRYYLENHDIARLGRVVMLAPPNQGSQVVDQLRDFPGFGLLNGPAGSQLGTDGDAVPLNLGPVDYEVGIIAGTATFNPILSLYLPNPDDGKVSVENTKVEGMRDFITLAHSHPFIMQAPDAIEQALAFIKSGQFVHHAP